MVFTALSWNLFHGRDFPPDPTLATWRSRLLRITERNDTHAQVNRDLFDEFACVLAAARWEIALLQECPPRWWRGLARACGAQAHGVHTARNSVAFLRSALARLNPDLIASNEGGSNLTLVRGEISERRELELRPGPRPERRVMAFTRAELELEEEIWIANLHLSAGASRRALAEHELLLAASRAVEWAGPAPLILGGDLNLRPRDSRIYEALEGRFGLGAPTGAGALDHLLVRGLDVVSAPAAWPPERREVRLGKLAVRLSDHAPVEATLEPKLSPRDPP